MRTESDAERGLATIIRWAGLPEPVREFRFHLTRRWRFDFAWPAAEPPLAVEVEGGTWVSGAHTRGGHFESDAEKYNVALLGGWRVLRVTPRHIEDGKAIEWIRAALALAEDAADDAAATEATKGRWG